ncbi:MAG: metallophosphoesterase [Lachnospiraceae bacterium]|nr:metallophosphoesterase [Lachnospiraceae bacterium]
MIFITGDCHCDFTRFNTENFPEQKEMTKEDYMIVCGDFGGVWDKNNSGREEKWWLDWLENKPFTTLFVDGNHENFDRLYDFPVEKWNGGNVHKVRSSVIHLMRGQVFNIEGLKFFTFGGARSHDISAGILEPDDPEYRAKKKQLDKRWEPYRINHISWWTEEMPSTIEMEEGRKNLEMQGNEVDFVVTHCCSSSTQACLRTGKFVPDELTDYLQEIRDRIKFKKWFFGHYHDNRNMNEKEILLYEQIIQIA